MRLALQARNGCMKISEALCGGSRWRRQGLGALGWQIEACRHRASQQLLPENARHQAEVPGKGHRKSVDRSVEREGEVSKNLTLGPIAEHLHRTGAEPVGVSQHLFERRVIEFAATVDLGCINWHRHLLESAEVKLLRYGGSLTSIGSAPLARRGLPLVSGKGVQERHTYCERITTLKKLRRPRWH